MPKLVELVGPYVLTPLAGELSPFITRSATASFVRLKVLVLVSTFAPVARRGCQAACSRPAKRRFLSLSSP